MTSLPSTSALLSYLSAASIAGTALAVGQHIAHDQGALSVYGLGLLQGVLLAALVASRLRKPSASADPSVTSPSNDGLRTKQDKTPRSLIKSVSCTETAVEPAAPAAPLVLEVEYSLEEYESMRKRQRGERKGRNSNGGPITPDSGTNRRQRRQSLRTPKSVTRLGDE